MDDLILVKHAQGAPGLRLLGIGPGFRPIKGVNKLIKLFNGNTSWAQNRSRQQIQKMLSGSKVIVSGWYQNNLVGFGRATTDEIFRAVLWDIVVDKQYENHGIGRKIITSIIENPLIARVERVYLMTTHCEDFYLKMNFTIERNQKMMLLNNKIIL
tara:strand:+ start:13 stop:480 length:468 start_codon:yes stop_codon:yes gene_type:complete